MTLPRSPLNAIPADILCAADYEWLAEEFMDPAHFAYVAAGSGDERTLARNRQAFDQTAIVPRLLRDVSAGHTRRRWLDQEWVHPILLAPVAYQNLAHPQGELASARAAAATDTCLVLSTLASQPLAEVARLAAPACWFQLYFQAHRAATVDLLRRAEMAGFTAIVVTLDTAIKLPGRRAQRAGFVLPPQAQAVNVAADMSAGPSLAPGASRVFQGAMRQAPTWDDLAWLQQQTRLPLIVKGVLHGDDARRLQAMGIAGLIVSNHGGRALDGAPAALRCLPAIRLAVGTGYPLLLDSGIRSGSDVFKALALGADAVLIGRLQVYALAVAGALGVAHLLRLLREELEVCMAQAGCATLADIGPAMIDSVVE
jgi:isopentenyl diphosphate isomerase/L-lactate dehydrogenase-like FMN-dependent dehydrogenase